MLDKHVCHDGAKYNDTFIETMSILSFSRETFLYQIAHGHCSNLGEGLARLTFGWDYETFAVVPYHDRGTMVNLSLYLWYRSKVVPFDPIT